MLVFRVINSLFPQMLHRVFEYRTHSFIFSILFPKIAFQNKIVLNIPKGDFISKMKLDSMNNRWHDVRDEIGSLEFFRP